VEKGGDASDNLDDYLNIDIEPQVFLKATSA